MNTFLTYRVHLDGFAAELVRVRKEIESQQGKRKPNISEIITKKLLTELTSLRQTHDDLLNELILKLNDKLQYNTVVYQIIESYLKRFEIRLCKKTPIHVPVKFLSDHAKIFDTLKNKLRDDFGIPATRSTAISEMLQEAEFLHICIYHINNLLSGLK